MPSELLLSNELTVRTFPTHQENVVASTLWSAGPLCLFLPCLIFLPGTFKIPEVGRFHLFVVTLLPINPMGTDMAQVSFATVATELGLAHKGLN